MSRLLPPETIAAFEQELAKEANLGALMRGAAKFVPKRTVRHGIQKGMGSGMGVGALGGMGIGGAQGAVSGYNEAREQGATRTQAGLRAVGRALGGAVRGGAIGAGVGATGGAALGALRPGQATRMAKSLSKRDDVVGQMSRLGERQLHGFVGGSARDIERLRGGAYQARKGLEGAQKALTEAKGGGGRVGLVDRARGFLKGTDSRAELVSRLGREQQTAQKVLTTAENAQNMGLTSIPGWANAIRREGVGKALGTGLREQWEAGGTLGKALGFGLPAASIGSAALTSGEPGGPGRAERIGRATGSLGYALGPLTFGASNVVGYGLEQGLGQVGRGVDYLAGHRRRPALTQTRMAQRARPVNNDPSDSGQAAVQRVFTDRGADGAPEIGAGG